MQVEHTIIVDVDSEIRIEIDTTVSFSHHRSAAEGSRPGDVEIEDVRITSIEQVGINTHIQWDSQLDKGVLGNQRLTQIWNPIAQRYFDADDSELQIKCHELIEEITR